MRTIHHCHWRYQSRNHSSSHFSVEPLENSSTAIFKAVRNIHKPVMNRRISVQGTVLEHQPASLTARIQPPWEQRFAWTYQAIRAVSALYFRYTPPTIGPMLLNTVMDWNFPSQANIVRESIILVNRCPFEPIIQAKEYFFSIFDSETSTDGETILVCTKSYFPFDRNNKSQAVIYSNTASSGWWYGLCDFRPSRSLN